jgi:hypothetical protein
MPAAAAPSSDGPTVAAPLVDLHVDLERVETLVVDGEPTVVHADHVVAAVEAYGPGTPAAVWAATKAALGLAASPVTVPALTLAALRTTRVNSARIAAFPDHLLALAEGRDAPLPGTRTLRAPAAARYLITSDLHRCIPGRLDWPERQGVKDLYLSVLAGYAEEGWHLIENGDVEDFWMVGGSTWGAVYDIAYLTGGAVGPDASRPGDRSSPSTWTASSTTTPRSTACSPTRSAATAATTARWVTTTTCSPTRSSPSTSPPTCRACRWPTRSCCPTRRPDRASASTTWRRSSRTAT